MKTVKNCAAQGDCLFRRVKKLPSNAVEQPQENRVVCAHSETGHDHAIDNSDKNVWLFTTQDPLVSYVKIKGYADVIHHRAWDTHETLRLYSDGEPEVVWEIRRQREFTPAGWRRVED